MSTRIGFVGLGTIGRPLAENLVRAGLAPTVFDLTQAAVDGLDEQGATGAVSVVALAKASDVVGVCVPADAHVRQVLGGPDGLLANLRTGAVVAIHSTVAPETIEWAAEAAAPFDVGIVEACLTGGPDGAAAGKTTFILGGEPDHIAALESLLAACGEVRVDAGALGKANLLKLCLNLQTYINHLGIAEALAMAKALEVPVAGLEAAMRANGQLSPFNEKFFGMHQLPLEILNDENVLALRLPQQLIVAKDMDLMRTVAAEHEIDIAGLETAQSRFERSYLLPLPEKGTSA